MHLDKSYYFKKHFPRKKVEDVLGGAESWENVDRTEGMSVPSSCLALELGEKTITAMRGKIRNAQHYLERSHQRSHIVRKEHVLIVACSHL